MQDFEEIVRSHGPMVYRLALATLRHRADAEDVFQEVFLRCARQTFRSDEHLKAWLLRVTVNQCRSLRRGAWFRRRAALTENTAMTVSPPDHSELSEALDLLPEKYRIIIHLYYYENYQSEEIARLLHLAPATVRTRLARARQQLAALLKEAYHDLS